MISPTTIAELERLAAEATAPGWFWDKGASDGGAPIIVGVSKRMGRRRVAKVFFEHGSEDPEVHANAKLIEGVHGNLTDLLAAAKFGVRLARWIEESGPELLTHPAREQLSALLAEVHDGE